MCAASLSQRRKYSLYPSSGVLNSLRQSRSDSINTASLNSPNSSAPAVDFPAPAGPPIRSSGSLFNSRRRSPHAEHTNTPPSPATGSTCERPHAVQTLSIEKKFKVQSCKFKVGRHKALNFELATRNLKLTSRHFPLRVPRRVGGLRRRSESFGR